LLEPGDRILDYGCGNKPYQSLFARKFREYIGADLPGNVDADIVIGTDGRLPVGRHSFDCVLSAEVLEHTVSPEFYLKETFRVLRPGGSLLLSVPAVWVYHPDPIDYWRWTIDGVRREITLAGFEILTLKGVFGPESMALQLWQDSTFFRLPSLLQPLYTWFFQTLIGLIERRRSEKPSENASIYIVLARKPMESVSGNEAVLA
jgi:SAM-dependent methyltransferase